MQSLSNSIKVLRCLQRPIMSPRRHLETMEDAPKVDERQLPPVPHVPICFPRLLPVKYPRADDEMRGPERVHNQLIYRQYGIIALGGGALRGAHFDVIRDRLNKFMDSERFFAIWRIDPPWKPVSKKSFGKKMGGGKAKVHHYESPVKAGRIIIEVAGEGQFEEISHHLQVVCNKLPLYARPITQQQMDDLKVEKEKLDAANYNPFEYRDLLRKNFSNSQSHIGPKERLWGGTYY